MMTTAKQLNAETSDWIRVHCKKLPLSALEPLSDILIKYNAFCSFNEQIIEGLMGRDLLGLEWREKELVKLRKDLIRSKRKIPINNIQPRSRIHVRGYHNTLMLMDRFGKMQIDRMRFNFTPNDCD